jgi:hypothetical protein
MLAQDAAPSFGVAAAVSANGRHVAVSGGGGNVAGSGVVYLYLDGKLVQPVTEPAVSDTLEQLGTFGATLSFADNRALLVGTSTAPDASNPVTQYLWLYRLHDDTGEVLVSGLADPEQILSYRGTGSTGAVMAMDDTGDTTAIMSSALRNQFEVYRGKNMSSS